jgi:neutral trehalase
MAWVGLERYGYLDDAQRLAYRFLYMYVLETVNQIISNFVGPQDDYCFC